MSILSQNVNLGEPARIIAVFFDEDHALETPTAATIITQDPAGAEVTTTSPDASITFDKVLPLALRTALAAAATRDGLSVTAADLVLGAGVLEFILTQNAAGNWQYDIKATAPSVSVESAEVNVVQQFP